MLQITPQMRVLVAVAPVDFRKGIDGLARLCKAFLKQDPFAGTVFVFCKPNHLAKFHRASIPKKASTLPSGDVFL